MNESKIIKGKVSAIIDESSVLINRGSNDGVRVGTKFRIYPEGCRVIVKDPDDPKREITLLFEAPIVIASDVHDNFTLCHTELMGGSGLFGYPSMGALMKREKLKYEKTALKTNVKPITVGDPVEEIPETPKPDKEETPPF